MVLLRKVRGVSKANASGKPTSSSYSAKSRSSAFSQAAHKRRIPARERWQIKKQKAIVSSQRMRRPKKTVGKPWPKSDLNAFDLPGEIGWGPLLVDVLKQRGWRFSDKPCLLKEETVEKSWGTDVICTVFTKTFEASLAGQSPVKYFGKKDAVQGGLALKKETPLPKHAFWLMGRSPYIVPDSADGRCLNREDFPIAVAQHSHELPGDPGNYRIFKFPGMETALFKTNLSLAFRDKPWYPIAFVLPKEKDAFLKEIRHETSSYWIAKPRNECCGAGIAVFSSTDPELAKLARTSDNEPRSVVQRYLAQPLLIGGYKFHMRIHLFVTSLDPPEAYVQENGQCLFATEPYSLRAGTIGENFRPPMHVTNMGLNATEDNKENFFRKKPFIGAGQQCRVKKLQEYLAAHHPDFDKKALWSQILHIAAETVRYCAKAPSIRQHGKYIPGRHMELLGMDLMLDKKLNVYMCEVNTDPGLDYPDKEILGEPNPDINKEAAGCSDTWHDVFSLLGLDAGKTQTRGSLKSWFKVDFDHANLFRRSSMAS